MFTGSHGRYQWLVDERNGIGHLIERCPAVFLQRYLVVACFDSGPFHPTAEEQAAGWRSENRLAYSPRLDCLNSLPHESFDEWYLFTSPVSLSSCELFINCGGFTLLPPYHSSPATHPTWDHLGAKALAENQLRTQARFWKQLEAFDAQSYIAAGDNFIFTTANPTLFARVSTAFAI